MRLRTENSDHTHFTHDYFLAGLSIMSVYYIVEREDLSI